MPASRFTVLICTRNRADSLARTLASVRSQRIGSGFETLVVDNGSTDNTPAVVSGAAALSSSPVRYLRCDAPGKSAALNAGIRDARGDIIAFTDDDALPEPSWLEEIERVFATKNCDWVYGPVTPSWETRPPRWFSPRVSGIFALLDLGLQEFSASESDAPFFGVNCAARRSAVIRTGGYRTDLGPTETLGGGGEDTEMFYRALRAGQRVVYAPTVCVQHIIPGERTVRGFHRRRMFRGGSNNYRLLQKPGVGGPRWLGVPRYYYSLALSDLIHLPVDYLRGRLDRAFLRELHLVRFASIVWVSLREARAVDVSERDASATPPSGAIRR